MSNPEWGVWSLSSPTSPNGQADYASVSINFAVNITAQPDTYSLAAQVVDDSLTDTVQSHPIQVAINEAPRLGVTASVGPSSVHPAGQVTYRVTVTNKGTGIAPTVDVLVTLPPVLQYQSTIMPFGGNASQESLISPVKGAYLVFYGGFELPPQTTLGPGTLTIEFIAQCIPNPGKGVFTIQVAVTDASRDHVERRQHRPPQRLQLLTIRPVAEGLGLRARGNLAYRARYQPAFLSGVNPLPAREADVRNPSTRRSSVPCRFRRPDPCRPYPRRGRVDGDARVGPAPG